VKSERKENKEISCKSLNNLKNLTDNEKEVKRKREKPKPQPTQKTNLTWATKV
jgi:hypothetical protein